MNTNKASIEAAYNDSNKPNPSNSAEKPVNQDADLDFLLKSQQQESESVDLKYRNFKIISILIAGIIIAISVFMVGSVLLNNNSSTRDNLDSEVTGSGIFNPSEYITGERFLSGEIVEVFNPENTANELRFELLDENGDRQAFVYSNTNDLELSMGLNVEIEGELQRRTQDGYDVVLVRSIVLKGD